MQAIMSIYIEFRGQNQMKKVTQPKDGKSAKKAVPCFSFVSLCLFLSEHVHDCDFISKNIQDPQGQEGLVILVPLQGSRQIS